MSVKVLWVLTGLTIATGAGTAYFALTHLPAPARTPAVATGTPAPPAAVTPAVQPAPPPPQPIAAPAPAPVPAAPRLPTIVGPSTGNSPPVAQAQARPAEPASRMPVVQRPSEQAPTASSDSTGGGPNQAISERGRDSHFRFDAVINGVRVPVLFDTGASVIALRAEDARRLGFDSISLNYSGKARTANGVAEVAPITIETITIGSITQHQVQAVVHRPGALNENLLGQSFMSRLAGYNVVQNQLVLKGR